MNCKQTYRFICENLDENLDSPSCLEIKKHLDGCPNCLKYLNSLKKTITLYREYKNPRFKKVSQKRLQSALNISEASKKRRQRSRYFVTEKKMIVLK
ncbi:MAG: zf-HC2 domain-containing protein [Candidatus Roizmanbacteria bacterium]|nr:zf-HC2 domain-containing protein [Candidatus Roizmanbacteria bacterium]